MTCTNTCNNCSSPCGTARIISGLDCLVPVDLATARVHVSYGNGKIGRITNFSTLPGSGLLTRKDGTYLTNVPGTCAGCCDACKDHCYAFKSLRYKNVIRAWAENTALLYADPELFYHDAIIVPAKRGRDLERADVSGEIPTEDAMREFFRACKIAGDYGMHLYTYTKRFEWLDRNAYLIPSNLAVQCSIWHDQGYQVAGCGTFEYDDGTDPSLASVFHCPAVGHDGKKTGVTCLQCKACLTTIRKAVKAH